ncbi:MAG: hypothetical protein AAFV33_02545 [Chloroflexota bacterium]
MEQKAKRSGCLRWLALPALLMALLLVSAALNAFRTPPDFAARMTLSPGITGSLLAGWAFLYGVCGVLLLRRRQNALLVSAWVVLGYIVAETLRPVLFAQSDYARGRLVFRLATALLTAIIPSGYLVYVYIVKRDRHNGEQ